MSTAETLQKNPLESEPGLSYEDQKESRDLIKNVRTRTWYKELADESYRTRGERYSGAFGFDHGGKLIAGIKLGRAEKKAKEHYDNHQSEYQAQAVKDAAADGVHTNFGEK